jgi:hypothetical protein
MCIKRIQLEEAINIKLFVYSGELCKTVHKVDYPFSKLPLPFPSFCIMHESRKGSQIGIRHWLQYSHHVLKYPRIYFYLDFFSKISTKKGFSKDRKCSFIFIVQIKFCMVWLYNIVWKTSGSFLKAKFLWLLSERHYW